MKIKKCKTGLDTLKKYGGSTINQRGRRFVEGHERRTKASQKYQKFEGQHQKVDNKDSV